MAKTFTNLWEEIIQFETLLLAWERTAKGRRRQRDVISFRANLEPNLIEIQESLIHKTYRTGPYHRFFVYEPKKRQIASLPLKDRVVQHALVHVIEPIFEARFIDQSFACRHGKGAHKGADTVQDYIQSVKRTHGNAATLYVNNANTATIAGVAFGGLVVTSGTTADVVATLSGTAGLTGLGVWAVYNLTNTGSVVASSTDTAAPLNFTALTPQLGDVFLGAAYSNTASTSTLWDWTNLTEDGEIQTAASARPFSVASWQANNTSSLTVTAALTGGAADSHSRGTVIQLR